MKVDYKEMSKIIEKPWIDVEGICKIAQCGKHSATKIRNEIEGIVIDSGKKLPISSKKQVPTKLLLEYLGLDEEYIYKMASRTA